MHFILLQTVLYYFCQIKKFIKFVLLQQIRVIVKNIEKSARDIVMILQNIHNTVYDTAEENVGTYLTHLYMISICKLISYVGIIL